MKNININLSISTCDKCPYYSWEDDNSCSNHAGTSNCKKADRVIEYDFQYPEIPKWCPLVEKKIKMRA